MFVYLYIVLSFPGKNFERNISIQQKCSSQHQTIQIAPEYRINVAITLNVVVTNRTAFQISSIAQETRNKNNYTLYSNAELSWNNQFITVSSVSPLSSA